jgi:hypothetical protein
MKALQRLSARQVVWAVLAAALLVRAAMLAGYQPAVYSDTHSYRRLAGVLQQWLQGGSGGYDGTRVPGYALFLALTGTDQTAWLVQMGLGVLITLLLFYLGWKLSGQAWLGGLVALLHTLNLGQLFFESSLLTETLATFFLMLALAGLVWGAELRRKAGCRPGRLAWLAGGMGLAAAAAVLTRPLFVYLPFLLALGVFFTWQPAPFSALIRADRWRGLGQALRQVFWPLAVMTLAVALPVLGWVRFIYNTYGFMSLTVMTGYHLVQHTGVFFEYVPDEEALLRDTYLWYRDVHIAETGTQTNTIWGAIPELSRVSGLTFYDLSRKLARISADLIRAHPDLYARNALKGWGLFWRAPVYWSPELLRWGAFQPLLEGLIWLQRILLVLANGFFVLTSLAALALKPLRQRLSLPAGLWVLAGAVWLGSIVQTLLDHGDNPRFLVPLQSLVVLWVVYVLFSLTPNPSPKGGWAHLIPSPRGIQGQTAAPEVGDPPDSSFSPVGGAERAGFQTLSAPKPRGRGAGVREGQGGDVRDG